MKITEEMAIMKKVNFDNEGFEYLIDSRNEGLSLALTVDDEAPEGAPYRGAIFLQKLSRRSPA